MMYKGETEVTPGQSNKGFLLIKAVKLLKAFFYNVRTYAGFTVQDYCSVYILPTSFSRVLNNAHTGRFYCDAIVKKGPCKSLRMT